MKPCNLKIENNNNNYIYIMVETGFIVAGVSIITIVLTKFKFYVKNGDWSCGSGFLDKPLVDEDEVEITYFELSDNVKGIYMKPKGHHHEETDNDTDDDDE